MREQSQVLKTFLLQKLYRHPQVMQMTGNAKRVVAELFAIFVAAPQEMQPGFAARAFAIHGSVGGPASQVERIVTDYIAGMTDRFATREHERLTGRRLIA